MFIPLTTELFFGIGFIGWGIAILVKQFLKIDIPLFPLFLIFFGMWLIFNRMQMSSCNHSAHKKHIATHIKPIESTQNRHEI